MEEAQRGGFHKTPPLWETERTCVCANEATGMGRCGDRIAGS